MVTSEYQVAGMSSGHYPSSVDAERRGRPFGGAGAITTLTGE